MRSNEVGDVFSHPYRPMRSQRIPSGSTPRLQEDYLRDMLALARARAGEAKASEAELRRIALDRAPAPALFRDKGGLEFLGTLNLLSVSLGLGSRLLPDLAHARGYLERLERAGFAGVSLVTEPLDLPRLTDGLGIDANRMAVFLKDFPVAPVQVWAARVSGAAGVHLATTLLTDDELGSLLDACREAGLVAILECFDGRDLIRIEELLDARGGPGSDGLWIAINARNLTTFDIDRKSLLRLAPLLPPGYPALAIGGLVEPAEAGALVRAGYAFVALSEHLMETPQPQWRLRSLRKAARIKPRPTRSDEAS